MRESIEMELQKDKTMQGVMRKIELAENHIDSMESHREISNAKFAKKDAKRTRELARLQERINETVIQDPI